MIMFLPFKDVRANNNELCVTESAKILGVTYFVSEIKRVESYLDFENLAHVIHHSLQGFIVENIEGESTEANDLGHIFVEVDLLHK